MLHKRKLMLILILIGHVCLEAGQSEDSKNRCWGIYLNTGVPYNFPIDIFIIHKKNRIKVDGDFYSEPFIPPLYWDLKFTYSKGLNNWEAELIHHKLILRENNELIDNFRITHGFNVFCINRSKKLSKLKYVKYGGGVVIPHPENSVDGEKLNEDKGFLGTGYYIGGPATQISTGVNKRIVSWFCLNLEIKLLAALCFLPISEGYAIVPHISVHLLGGFGFNWNYLD